MRNHPIPRARGPRGGDLKSQAEKHKAKNIEVAEAVLADPDKHPILTVEWARLTLGLAKEEAR